MAPENQSEVQIAVFQNETCYGNGNLYKNSLFVYLQPSVNKNFIKNHFLDFTIWWHHCENYLYNFGKNLLLFFQQLLPLIFISIFASLLLHLTWSCYLIMLIMMIRYAHGQDKVATYKNPLLRKIVWSRLLDIDIQPSWPYTWYQ